VTDQQQRLLERYVCAWESMDVEGFAALLTEDVTFSMPPWPQWYRGRDAVRTCFAWTGRLGGHAPFRLAPTAANGQPAFAFYSCWQGAAWRFHSVQVVTLEGQAVSSMTSFVVPGLASAFGLPAVLPDDVARP
jgi:RNA polymerase sigma-70 factor (ECF subfamily)